MFLFLFRRLVLLVFPLLPFFIFSSLFYSLLSLYFFLFLLFLLFLLPLLLFFCPITYMSTQVPMSISILIIIRCSFHNYWYFVTLYLWTVIWLFNIYDIFFLVFKITFTQLFRNPTEKFRNNT